jgi:hypothetical protein
MAGRAFSLLSYITGKSDYGSRLPTR